MTITPLAPLSGPPTESAPATKPPPAAPRWEDGAAAVTGQRPRILVVEDDAGLRGALRRVLQETGYETSGVGDAFAALEQFTAARPHLVLLDVMLPRGDGIELCRQLRRRPEGRQTAVLIVSARDALADRVHGLEAGADDYLVKPFAMEELLARVKAHLRRVWEPVPAALTFAGLKLDVARHTAHRGGRTVDLTTTEAHLLELFLRHPQQVLSRKVIGEQLWGIDFESESNVIEVYVRRLRRKLEAPGEPALIYTARGAGYALRSEPFDLSVPPPEGGRTPS